MDPTAQIGNSTNPLQQLLGGGASLAGAGLATSNLQNNYGVLQNALQTIGPTQLSNQNLSGPGGMSSGYNFGSGQGNINLGNLNGAFGNFSNAAGAGAGNYDPAMLQSLTNTSNGTMPQALQTLLQGYSGNQNYQNAAATQANGLQNTYNQVYGNTLSSLQAQQQPGVQQQAFGLQNTLFGNGTLGSTGATSGAIAAGNFGSQVNAMNAQNSLSAQQQALGAMQGQSSIASQLSGTGNSLLNNAFSNFGNTNQLISGLNTAQLNNAATATQGAGALNTMGLNNYNSSLQTGSAGANATNMSLIPYAMTASALANQPNAQSGIAQLLSGLGGSLTGANGLAGALFGSGGAAGAAGGANGAAGGIIGALKSLFGGGASGSTAGGSGGIDFSSLLNGSNLGGGGAPGSINSNYGFNQGGYDPTTGQYTAPTDTFGNLNFGSASNGYDPTTGSYSPTDTGTEGLFDSSNFLGNFSGAGGQAATSQPLTFNASGSTGGTGQATDPSTGFSMPGTATPSLSPGTTSATANPGIFGSAASSLSSANSLFNIEQGLASGKPTGYASAAIGSAALANKAGAFGGAPSASLGQGLGTAGGALGIYSGLQKGGVAGYGQAAQGALQAGSGIAGLAGNAALSQGLGAAAGALAVPLSVYNFAKNYQSGATGSDALSGAEAGASIGSIIPGVGTVIGGLVGGAVGALSSAFGGGKNDPETLQVNSLNSAIASGKTTGSQALSTPQNAFSYLAGVMDAKNATAGHSEPIEQVFGRMGEGNLTSSMFNQINSALSSGSIAKNASPTDIYNNVVAPWLKSKGAAIDPNSKDLKGNNTGNQIITSLQSLIGSWQSGSLTSKTAIGSSGQTMANMPVYGA